MSEWYPEILASDVPIAVDLYDPMNLEALESQNADQLVPYTTQLLRDQVARGDFFFCASERQRDYWIGMLAGRGPRHERGLPRRPRSAPAHRRRALRHPGRAAACAPAPGVRGVVAGIGDDDPLLIWNGGLWGWFEPELFIRAIDIARAEVPNVRAYFMGVRDPRAKELSPRGAQRDRARRAARAARHARLLQRLDALRHAPERLSRRDRGGQLPPRAPRDALLVPHAHPRLHLGLAADRLQRGRRARRPRAQRAARHHGRRRATSTAAAAAIVRIASDAELQRSSRENLDGARAPAHLERRRSQPLVDVARARRRAARPAMNLDEFELDDRTDPPPGSLAALRAAAAAQARARARPSAACSAHAAHRPTVEPAVIRQLVRASRLRLPLPQLPLARSQLALQGVAARRRLVAHEPARDDGHLHGRVLGHLPAPSRPTTRSCCSPPTCRSSSSRRAVSLGVPTLVANAGLIKKVYFPRELLPLSMTAASFVNFLFTMVLLLPAAAYAREGVNVWALLALVPVAASFFLATAGLVMLLAALNVYFRDVEFLSGIILTVLFYLTPVVYTLQFVDEQSHTRRALDRPQSADAVHRGLPHGHLLQGGAGPDPDRGVRVHRHRRLRHRLRRLQPPQGPTGGGAVSDTAPRSRVDGVSKSFRIYRRRETTLKETILRGRRGEWEELRAADNLSFTRPQGPGARRHRPERRGQVDAAQDARAHPLARQRQDRDRRARLGAARARSGLPPRVLRDREHLPLGRVLRHVALAAQAARRLDHRVRRARAASPTTRSRRTRAACTRGSASRSRSASSPTSCSATRCSRSATRASASAATTACWSSATPAARSCS